MTMFYVRNARTNRMTQIPMERLKDAIAVADDLARIHHDPYEVISQTPVYCTRTLQPMDGVEEAV